VTLRRHALVTGSSSGIGASIVDRLIDDGWRVTGIDFAPSKQSSSNFTPITLDLTDSKALEAVLRPMKGVSALVHAAGFMRVNTLGELVEEEGEAMWRIHVRVAEVLANRLVDQLPRGGRIVLVGSRTGGGATGRSQYAATKAALVGMARSWAAELAPRGITVNVVAPGATDTPMLNDPARAAVKPRLPPIGRMIQPREVAALTSFLLSEDAAAITGQQILVCGGASL
jgi:3-oxoacyl-[acyl-carrier protein] reductase